jgi:hypothetical protein
VNQYLTLDRYATDSQSLIRSRWEEERRLAEFEKQAAARELLGGERPETIQHDYAHPRPDSMFQPSAGTSGTATPMAGPQHPVQSNPMSAPPPKQISMTDSPPYEVEEVEDDLVTAPR